MKILNAHQIKEVDKQTLTDQNITSYQLMQRAGNKLFETLISLYPDTSQNFTIMVGTGNNGGDGLIIAYHLFRAGYGVRVLALQTSSTKSQERIEAERLLETFDVPIYTIQEKQDVFFDFQKDFIIDAWLGAGLSRQIDGYWKQWVEYINSIPNNIVSIDMPSGMFVHQTHIDSKAIIRANHTLTIQQPKLNLLLPDVGEFAGKMHIVDIELSAMAIEQQQTPYFYVDEAYIKNIFKSRNTFSHKGTFGHALVIGGKKGSIGAVVLASQAALKSGVGLLTAYLPKCGYEIFQTTTPEAQCITDIEADRLENLPDINLYNSIGMGIGMGTDPYSFSVVEKVLDQVQCPWVIDADALNILSQNKAWLSKLTPNCILTPHPKEFKRLVGTWNSDEEKLQKLQTFSQEFQCFVVLKGAYSIVSTPDGLLYFNSTGNPGMATAGSGDVLTGVITSLLAQGYNIREAAILGVYLHGLAGDIAKEKYGLHGLVATNIIESLPKAFQKFE